MLMLFTYKLLSNDVLQLCISVIPLSHLIRNKSVNDKRLYYDSFNCTVLFQYLIHTYDNLVLFVMDYVYCVNWFTQYVYYNSPCKAELSK